MKKIFISLLCICTFSFVFGQEKNRNPYHLPIVNDYKEYRESLIKNPEFELIDLNKAIPSLVLDIRYATTNNFMKQVMYKQARAFARKPVAEQLKKIQKELKKDGYGLKIFDGYRPYQVTVEFYEKADDNARKYSYVADPKKGSKHNRGCAVDITLIDLKTGKDVEMPTPYDSFDKAAWPSYQNLPNQIIKNRTYLINMMEGHGFKVIANEWWHFDFVGWEKFPLMDIAFEDL